MATKAGQVQSAVEPAPSVGPLSQASLDEALGLALVLGAVRAPEGACAHAALWPVAIFERLDVDHSYVLVYSYK